MGDPPGKKTLTCKNDSIKEISPVHIHLSHMCMSKNYYTSSGYYNVQTHGLFCTLFFRKLKRKLQPFITPLRPYLEKIKGSRWPDIFHIRPWAHRDALYPAVSVYLLSMHACFPPHAQSRSWIFRATEARLAVLFLCLLSTYFVGSNHIILQFKSS